MTVPLRIVVRFSPVMVRHDGLVATADFPMTPDRYPRSLRLIER